MKKIFTSLCATLLAVAASAQVTATISPSDKNVFTPSEYGYVSVTYGDTLTLSSAVATVSYGTASTTVAVDSTVKKNASNLNGLPKGVYIIGGKKVVIR